MARVISWRIDNKFVYIEDRNQHPQCIYDAQWDNERIRQHGRTVLGWSESVYEANFNYMYGKVSEQWGTATDLRSDYRFYYNATEEDGVYMLSGIDGANIADYGKPFYNLVIENANTSLGLGGDYTLDVDATVKTWIYLERNGTVYLPDEVSVKYGSETVASRTYNEPGRTRVEIDIPRGTMFSNNERNREYEITAKKNGFEGRVLFTVVGVKDGEEGMSYDLLVTPKLIKVNSDGEPSNNSVKCEILKNGEIVPLGTEGFQIRYTYGIATTDYDDVENVYSSPISYSMLSEHDDQVNFYLYVNGRIVDTDSCIVSRDGIDGGFMKLELDNEIDAVGLGSDSKLDVSGGVKFKTGMILYSAGTELTITRVVVDDGNGNQALPCTDSTGKAHYSVEGLQRKYSIFHTTLDDGYEFGLDLRNSVKITAYGTNDRGEEGHASANYILLGIQGAEDGVTYKLMPTADYILYDPNTRLVKWGTSDAISVDEIAGHSLGFYPLESGRQKSGGEIVSDHEFLSYSVGITYTNAGSAVAPILSGQQPQNGMTFRLSELFNEEITAENATSKFVTFYWCKEVGGNFVMLDRETVPVIIQGINGNSIWVELGNEIDAVGVGEDTDLDIVEDVTIGTTVRIISGGTPIRIESIEVIKPRGTESNWDDYAESTTGYTGSDHAMPDNGTHTIGYVSITLKNGFEFGSDYREAPTIKATAVAEDGGWSGFTQYVIKGIANGKDGYVYRLMPEVDYVTFNPNAGHDGTLDENEVSCAAYYGKYELGESGFTNGTIYYSVNCIYDTIPDNIPDTSMSGEYVTGFTEYISSVSLDEILSKENYWNFKYIAFYLVVDTNMPDGTVSRELVDRETVKIISDGLDGQSKATIELTNEIDSIGLGGDTILDLPAGETRRMSTGVRVFSGGTRLSIYELTGAFQAGSNAPSGTYSFGRIPPATENDDDVFYVDLTNGFNFGKDYKEKVVVTAKARNNENNEVATVSAIFVLAGIKSGKDGETYKIQPTPDFVFYDLQLGRFVGDNNISAWAYSNGKLLSGSSTYNTDYQIKYTNNVLYDLETAEQNWGSTVFKAYQPEGNNLHFDAPSGSLDREQAKVFYLAVRSEDGSSWTVVDRESVPLFINGKEGKDGVGAIRFDMTNPFEVINTGEDLTLDSSSWKSYSTVVYGYEGTGKVKITCTSKPSDTSTMKVSAVTASDGFGVTVTVYLRNYTFDSATQKLSVPLSFWFDDDHAKSGSLTYTLVAIMNGKGAEGDAYRLRTNVSRISTNATSFSPETLLAGVYLGNTLVPATIYAKYKPEGEYLSTLEQMDTRSYDTYSSYTSNALSTTITKAAGNDAKNKNGTLYIAAFDGTSVNAQFLDADDIPIQVDYDEGSASGILADLSDDVGVVGVGDNEKLEADVIGKLTTIGYIFKGRPPMKLSSVDLPNNGNAITDYGGKIQFVLRNFTAGVSTSAEIGINITATTEDYVDFRNNNPLQFNIVLHGAVEEGEEAVERTVGYSLLGLKDGKDGETIHLELNANKIYHNQDTGFSPSDIRCRLYYCGEDITSESAGGENATLKFLVKNSDWEDEQGSEIFWIDEDGHYDPDKECYIFSISDQEYSEYEPLCIRAERKTGNSGTDADWTLLDWETVQVLRDGKDGIGGIELKFDNSPAYVTQVDGSKVVTEDVTATTYATLYSGSTTVKLNSLTLLPDESEYDSSKIHFNSDCPANGSAYVEVGIDAGFSFANLSPVMLRIEGIGTDPDTNEPVVRRATFSIYDAAGGKGERGPKTRIRYWSDATTVDYQNGSDDDAFWDIIYYVTDDGEFGGYFGCKTDQASGATKIPPIVENGEPNPDDNNWVYYPDYDFVATKVISVGDWPDGWVIDKGKIQHTSSSITLNGHTAAIEVKEGASAIYSYKNGNELLYTKQDFHNQQEFDSNVDGYISVYTDSECTGSPVTNTYVLRGTSGRPTIVLPSTVVNIPMVLKFDGVRFWLTRSTNLNVPIEYSISFRLYKSEKVRYDYSDGSYVYSSVHGYTDYKNAGTMAAGSLSSVKTSIVEFADQRYDLDTTTDAISEDTVNSSIWDVKFGFHPQVVTLSSVAKSNGVRLGAQKEYEIDDADWGGDESGGGGSVLPPPTIIDKEDPLPDDEPVTIEDSTIIYSYLYYRVTGMSLNGNGANVYISSVSDSQPGTNKYRKSNEIDGETIRENVIITGSDMETNEKVYTYESEHVGEQKPLAALINGNVNADSEYGDIVIAAGIENGTANLYKWTASTTTDEIYTFTNLSELPSSTDTQAYMGFEKPYEIMVKKKDSNTIVYNGNEFGRSTTTVTVPNLSRFAVSRLYKDGTLVTSKLYATDGSFDGKINAKYGNFTGGLDADHCNISNANISDSKFSGSVDIPSDKTLIAYNASNLPYFTVLDGAVNEGFNRFGTVPFYREDSGSWLGLGGKTYTNQVHDFLSNAQVSGGGVSVKIPSFNFRVSGAKIKQLSATLTIIQDTRPVTTLKTVNLVPSSGETGCSYSWTGDTFTVNSSAPLKITMTYSFSIGGGKGRISMLGDFSGPIEIGRSNTTANYIFGSNGAYLTDGKSVVSLNRTDGITLSVGYNAIKITNGDIVLETTRTVGTGTSQTTTKYSMSLRDLLVKNIGNTTGYMLKTVVNNEGTI